MKAAIILAILSVLAIGQTAVLTNPTSSRANLQVGFTRPGDILLNRSYVSRPAQVNAIQYQDFIYRGNATNRISFVSAIEVGATQLATARILQGGVGWGNVTVRVQSARGRGYNYRIEVWGR